jgi:hypothetical protein
LPVPMMERCAMRCSCVDGDWLMFQVTSYTL